MAMGTEPQDRSDLRVVQQGDENAPHEAIALLEHAHRVAEDTMTTARAEAERLLMAARNDAQQLRKQAHEEAERETSEARRNAEMSRAQAREEAERLLSDARGAVGEIEASRDRAIAARDSAIESAREVANRLLQTVESHSRESSSNEG